MHAPSTSPCCTHFDVYICSFQKTMTASLVCLGLVLGIILLAVTHEELMVFSKGFGDIPNTHTICV